MVSLKQMMITVVCLAVLPLLFLQCQSLWDFLMIEIIKQNKSSKLFTYFIACHCQACTNHRILACFCFPQLQQHRCNFENYSGGGLLRAQQLLLSSAAAGVILEGTFGRLSLKKINYTGTILQTWRQI